MSHYHLEVIMPPTEDVEQALEQILKPFDEQGEDEGGNCNTHTFYDFYCIGGRWSGRKLEAKIGEERIQAFRDRLVARGVTVSGLQFGKPTLEPRSQIGEVDALWCEMFPDCGIPYCPLFDHTPKTMLLDICSLAEVPEGLTAERVIIAKPYYADETQLEAGYMTQKSLWNGVNHEDSTWDGTIVQTIERWKDYLKNAREDYKATRIPQADWLCVTVDYHS